MSARALCQSENKKGREYGVVAVAVIVIIINKFILCTFVTI